MWDPKPDSPAEIRGEFKTIPTIVPGVLFGEHLPKLARQMHRCTLVRSMHHSVNNAHAAAVYCGLTGHDRGEIGGGARPDDTRASAAVLGMAPAAGERPFRPARSAAVHHEGRSGGPPQPGFYGGWLGKPRDPLIILREPERPRLRRSRN